MQPKADVINALGWHRNQLFTYHTVSWGVNLICLKEKAKWSRFPHENDAPPAL